MIISFDVLAKLETLFASKFGTTRRGMLSAVIVLAVEFLCYFPVFTYSWYISKNKVRQVFNCGFVGFSRLAFTASVPYL